MQPGKVPARTVSSLSLSLSPPSVSSLSLSLSLSPIMWRPTFPRRKPGYSFCFGFICTHVNSLLFLIPFARLACVWAVCDSV